MARVVRAAAALVVAAVLALVVVGVAPYAFREQRSSGPVADTAAALPGQAGRATDALRGLGYSCSDAITATDTVTRSCSRVRNLTTARVRMLLTRDTGVLQLAATTIDGGRSAARRHAEVLGALARAVGLPVAEQAELAGAAAGSREATLALAWGEATVRPGAAPESTLRAVGSDGLALLSSPTTLAVPVSALAAAAEANGYTCVTPQVETIRSCERSDGRYYDDLWMQGTETYTTSVTLSVGSTYGRRTRSHWVDTMTQAMGWVDTDQTRAVRRWLAGSADAPGADGYVDGLPVVFTVRTDQRYKETSGGIHAECAVVVDDLSGCDPQPRPANRPG